MEKPSVRVAIVMERVAIANRWQPYRWQLASVLPDLDEAAPRTLVRADASLQRLYPGFEIVLHRDETEGYYLNVSAPDPRVFVMWRLQEDRAGADDEAQPLLATVSYNEAARWMDAQEKVDSVPIPEELHAWLARHVQENYKPDVKRERIRPRSFESKEGRYKRGMG